MVSTRHAEYRYITASDSELDTLLRGENVGGTIADDLHRAAPLQSGKTGVLVAVGRSSGGPVRPLALVAGDQDVRRLCGRYAQLRTELSPLTAWCHLLTPNTLRSLDGIAREPSFRGTEAAWSGLVVAEAMLLAGRPLANIRISACLASATYAIGRTRALWKDLSLETIVERFDVANKLCRTGNAIPNNRSRISQVRSSFVPMWTCLSTLTGDSTESSRDDVRPLVMALTALREARSCGHPDEANMLVRPLLNVVPEARTFDRLTEMEPEARLRLFDVLANTFKEADANAFLRRNALALTAGYLATVAAGGAASLALVENHADGWPELVGWAYLVGGIGERITWTSGFDGLGRLVARELQRRLRLDEPPTCDFSLDEALVLSDPGLKEPLVHLRIKQARLLSVALFPGVNIAIPIVDTTAEESTQGEWRPKRSVSGRELRGARRGDPLEVLAAALWPFLQPLVTEATAKGSTPESGAGKGSQRSRETNKQRTLSRLPLGKSRK